eukprot:TRINITY_DN78238_c0_g1_i1.p1 TRINITY_DN78238_c0_g1~~TRINITY_DN78238_c0_g1_i1.p1  ORF type:complete len:266 (-),score=91.94 TRINITY_DN78238_c0_g1_i1:32-829(-)
MSRVIRRLLLLPLSLAVRVDDDNPVLEAADTQELQTESGGQLLDAVVAQNEVDNQWNKFRAGGSLGAAEEPMNATTSPASIRRKKQVKKRLKSLQDLSESVSKRLKTALPSKFVAEHTHASYDAVVAAHKAKAAAAARADAPTDGGEEAGEALRAMLDDEAAKEDQAPAGDAASLARRIMTKYPLNHYKLKVREMDGKYHAPVTEHAEKAWKTFEEGSKLAEKRAGGAGEEERELSEEERAIAAVLQAKVSGAAAKQASTEACRK